MIQIQEILDLSVAERMLMIEKIWDSISPDDVPLSTPHQQELDSRLARHKNADTRFYSWNDIKTELKDQR